MGLFKSVLADARPAKTAGRSAYALASLSGVPLHSQNSNNKVNDSGPNTSAEVMRNAAASNRLSPYGESAPVKSGLSNSSREQRQHKGHGETELSFKKQSVRASTALQNNLATGLVEHFGEDPRHQTPDIDQPTIVPEHETKWPRPALPVFTLANQGIESTVPAGSDQQADLPQGFAHISDNGKSTVNQIGDRAIPAASDLGSGLKTDLPQGYAHISDDGKSTVNQIGDRAISDNTAAITIGRDDNLSKASDKAIDSVESQENADVFWHREKVFHAEEKPQPTTSAIDWQFSGEDEFSPQQATAEVQSSVTQHPPAKLANQQSETKALVQPDRQPRQNDRIEPSSTTNNPGGKPDQLQPIDSVPSIQQSKTTLFSATAELAEDAQLRKLTNDMQQQHQKQLSSIEKHARLVEARSTTLIDDQFARHYASEPRSLREPSFEATRTAEVKIGQVDVFIEKTSAASSPGNRTTRPSVSLASRHYLRRL